MARGDGLNVDAWWWPYHPACRYDGDDADDDGWPELLPRAKLRETGNKRPEDT